MSELKERKPDGGLADLIEFYEEMGGEDDGEMLVLLLELRAFRRTRDKERERISELEAELARRDAAAGEPVAFTHESEISNMRATGLYIRGFPADRRLNAEEGYTVALFTSAQASALPWKVESCSNCGSKNHSWDTTVIKNTRVHDGLLKLNETSGLFYLGCDECSETLLRVSADEVASYLNNAKALGAQPEKFVVLPKPYGMQDHEKWLSGSEVIKALDAAGVKWKEAE